MFPNFSLAGRQSVNMSQTTRMICHLCIVDEKNGCVSLPLNSIGVHLCGPLGIPSGVLKRSEAYHWRNRKQYLSDITVFYKVDSKAAACNG